MPSRAILHGDKEDFNMAEKLYTPKQAVEAVLKKTQELLAKSELMKAEPKGEIRPKEKVQGEPAKPGERVEEQKAPESNPAEQKEGNNELAGTTPTQVGQDGKNVAGFDEMKGHLKLAKFLGHMESKRKSKAPAAPAALDAPAAQAPKLPV